MAVRDWQDGIAYDLLLRQRRFSADEVLLLLRQVLPVLAVWHVRGLVHGDLNARHLLRRSSDGLPVLLEGGGVQRAGMTPTDAPWRDLHDLGVTALVLLGGTAGDPPSVRKAGAGGEISSGAGAPALGGTGAPFRCGR